MYVLLENNYIVAGPFNWNARLFQNILNDDYEITYNLPYKTETSIKINDELALYPINNTTYSSDFNPKVQQLVGPYSTVNNEAVDLSYNVIERDINIVKEEIKAEIKAARQAKENAGFNLTIDGVELAVPTDRESRAIFHQALTLGAFDKNWKFGDVWATLSQADLITLVGAVLSFVQEAFDWEKAKVDELNAVSSVLALANFEVVPQPAAVEPQA